jgi:hypothetical protein
VAIQSATIALNFLGRHAGVGSRYDLEQPLLAGRRQRPRIALEHRLERLRVLPFRVLRRQRLDAVEREGKLEIDRLLGPQRAVVVERGDPLLGWDEVRPALLGHRLDEFDDRLLGRALVPGRQRIGGRRLCRDALPAPCRDNQQCCQP